MKLNCGKLYLFGLMLADGGIYKYRDKRGPNSSHFQTDFVADESLEFAFLISKLVKHEFDISTKLIRHSKANCYYVSNYKKDTFFKFARFGMPKGNKTDNVIFPYYFRGLPLKSKLALVRGIFDGEATVTIKKENHKYKDKIHHYQYPVIELKMSSSKIIEQIAEILNEIGIYYSKYFYPEKRRYEIHIRDNFSLKKFKQKIGFLHPIKKEKLEKYTAINNSWATEKRREQTELLQKCS